MKIPNKLIEQRYKEKCLKEDGIYLKFTKDGCIEYECTEEYVEKLISEGKIKAGDDDNV